MLLKKLFGVLSLSIILTSCAIPVKGVITDKDTGEPVASAVVSVGNSVSRTDAYGRYRLMVVDYNDTMLINAPGYNLHTRSFQLDHTNGVDIQLICKDVKK